MHKMAVFATSNFKIFWGSMPPDPLESSPFGRGSGLRPLRLRAHVYVFKKIRFRKDPFWGVHTYRTSIRRPRSHGRGLILGNVPPPENHGLCVWTRLELKSHFFCLFPLLASVVLLYCFTCLCPVEGVYVVCESWRQVIKERLQRQNET